ncbi:MAG: beta-lactamase family protein, partial [Verrucomicrobia bacterium]|nr:beta-lactamase family protein [Verrucomicrobiota bacterium]
MDQPCETRIILRKKSSWSTPIIALILAAAPCLAQEGKSAWATATEDFLSELMLVKGEMNTFTPDTYFAPGGIICVVVAGKPVHCRPFGYSSANNLKDLVGKPAHLYDPAQGTPVRENSLFRLGSTSKLFVGLALALCKGRGLVQYDGPVSKYLRELEGTAVGRITLQQLFTHSGGLPSLHKPGLRERDDEVVKATMPEVIRSVAQISPDAAKVNRFSYSNVGVLLLAEVIGRVQSRPYEAFVENEILVPLGMKHTCFHPGQIDRSLKTTGYFPNFNPATDPDLQAYAPVGGMYSTGPDMAKLMSLLQQALNGKEPLPSPFKPEIIRDLTADYLREGQRAMGVSVDIGYGEAQTMIGHN